MSSLLSICIPTHNRANCLAEIIKKMVDLCLNSNVDIYISDNASTDSTQSVCEELAKDYPFIHYFRQSNNIGPDDNFEFVLKMSTSKYRWPLSDTTFVENIDTVIEDLSKREFDAYIVNGNCVRASNLPKDNRLYSNTKDLIVDVGWHMTWISCMIYSAKIIDGLDFVRYKNSSFNQMAIIFETCANRESHIKFNSHCVVGNLPVNKVSGWYFKVFDVFYHQLFSMLMSLPLYYSDQEKLICFRNHTQKAEVLKRSEHVARRLDGYWNAKDVLRNKFYIKLSGEKYFFLLFIGYCPIPVLRFLLGFKKSLRKAFSLICYNSND